MKILQFFLLVIMCTVFFTVLDMQERVEHKRTMEKATKFVNSLHLE